MRFFVKLKDAPIGVPSVTLRLDSVNLERMLWEHIKPLIKIPDEAWLVSINLEVTADCESADVLLESGDDD
jgi:hypothetical protein